MGRTPIPDPSDAAARRALASAERSPPSDCAPQAAARQRTEAESSIAPPRPFRLDPNWTLQIEQVRLGLATTTGRAQVALLRHHGLSDKQVASVLGRSVETVRSTLRRLYRDNEIVGIVDLALRVERILAHAPPGDDRS